MAKFRKRITKMSKKPLNDALVLGTGFGEIPILLEIYNTVFVYDEILPNIKAKNLVVKKDIDSCYNITTVTGLFIDLKYVNLFDKITPLLSNPRPELFVEGDEVIPKTETKNLWRCGYRPLERCGSFHYWSKVE